jgi:hypothetical protein
VTDVDALASVARDDELALTIDGADHRLTVEHRVLEPQFPPASVADEIDHDPVPGAIEIAATNEAGGRWSLRLPCDLNDEPTGEVEIARRVVTDIRVPAQYDWHPVGTFDADAIVDSIGAVSGSSRESAADTTVTHE